VFILFHTATAVILVFVSLLYWLKISSNYCIIGDHVKAIHILEIIVGIELLISLSCLLYYIGELYNYGVLFVCMYVCTHMYACTFIGNVMMYPHLCVLHMTLCV